MISGCSLAICNRLCPCCRVLRCHATPGEVLGGAQGGEERAVLPWHRAWRYRDWEDYVYPWIWLFHGVDLSGKWCHTGNCRFGDHCKIQLWSILQFWHLFVASCISLWSGMCKGETALGWWAVSDFVGSLWCCVQPMNTSCRDPHYWVEKLIICGCMNFCLNNFIKLKIIFFFCSILGRKKTPSLWFHLWHSCSVLLQALCPVRDVPPQSNHGDPLSYYQTGDLIRGEELQKLSGIGLSRVWAISVVLSFPVLFLQLPSRTLIVTTRSWQCLSTAQLFHPTFPAQNWAWSPLMTSHCIISKEVQFGCTCWLLSGGLKSISGRLAVP